MRNFLFFIVISAFSLMLLVLSLSDAQFFTRGEAREALVVQSMYSQSNFVLPLRNGNEIPSKPPMFHWLAAAASYSSQGMNEWAIRLPSAVLGALGIGLLAWFAFAHSGLKVAVFSTIFAISSFEWMRSSSHARVDMTFSFFFLLTVFLLYLLIHKREKYYWTIVITSAIAAAATTLAKGPAGLVLPYGIVGTLALVRSFRLRSIKTIPLLSLMESFLVAVVLAASWYGSAYLMHGQPFVYKQIFSENIARLFEVPQINVGHQKPFYYSIIYLLTVFMPWTLFLPIPACWLWVKRRELAKRDDLLLCLIWIMAFFCAVTLSVSKRQVYFLPLIPALAYLLAISLADMSWLEGSLVRYRKYLGYLFLAASVLFLSAAVVLLLLHFLPAGVLLRVSSWFGRSNHQESQRLFELLSSSFVVYCLLGFSSFSAWFYYSSKPGRQFYFSLILIAAVSVSISAFVQKSIFEISSQQVAAREFALLVSKHAKKDTSIFQFENNFFPVVFYLERDVRQITRSSKVLLDGSGYLLVKQSDVEQVRLLAPEGKQILTSAAKSANGKQALILFEFGLSADSSLTVEDSPPTIDGVLDSSSIQNALEPKVATAVGEQKADHLQDQSLEAEHEEGLLVDEIQKVQPAP